MGSRRLGIIIISYGHDRFVPDLIDKLVPQMNKGDRVIIVDNHPEGKVAEILQPHPQIKIVKAENKGYSIAGNTAVGHIIDTSDVLFFVGPGNRPSDNLLDVIRSADYDTFSAVMPLVTLPDGKVNSAGNVTHISGLSWCDGYLHPKEKYTEQKEVHVISGAGMAISKEWWHKLGGLSESYFMYYEDTDLSARILLQGGKIGLLPDAYVEHEYDFTKGGHKWLYLERNRPIFVLRTWPIGVLLVLFPQLVMIELMLWLVAAKERRLLSKLKAAAMFVRVIPKTLRERRKIQSSRSVTSSYFLTTLVHDVDTPLLGAVSTNKLIKKVFAAYYKACAFVLRLFSTGVTARGLRQLD